LLYLNTERLNNMQYNRFKLVAVFIKNMSNIEVYVEKDVIQNSKFL
jgi:hypothetical protein